jgi:type III pantothenate kinase
MQPLLIKAQNSIFSSVVSGSDDILEILSAHTFCIHFTHSTPIPIANSYQSIETLGTDRIAAAVGASKYANNKNILSIDTGTCIKYNFVQSGNNFIGGAIAPGLQMRLTALHKLTSKLPLVAMDQDYNELIGTDTKSSILSGALTAAVAEMDGMIDRYKEIYSNVEIILSGGDCIFFEKRLKNSIFTRPNLVIEGLNAILEFNVENKT